MNSILKRSSSFINLILLIFNLTIDRPSKSFLLNQQQNIFSNDQLRNINNNNKFNEINRIDNGIDRKNDGSFRTKDKCPIDSPISCHLHKNLSDEYDNVDSCCTNLPGGQLLLTQFWDTHPPAGPIDSWTIHGLWPDNCDGTYEASCDSSRNYNNITEILEEDGKGGGNGGEILKFMRSFWKDQNGNDEKFWEHEWGKHGTCISTLEPHCSKGFYKPQSEVVAFFNRTVQLFKELPTHSWLADSGIVPSHSNSYTLEQLQDVAIKRFGHEAVWNCRGHNLNEVWWHFNTRGSVVDEKFIPTNPIGPRSTCPHSGIQYLPKDGKSGGGGGRGGGGHNPKRPNRPSPTRKHFIYVIDSSGRRNGCLIGSGNWYRRGTCASFSVDEQKSGSLIIKSKKGPCTFSGDHKFSCSKGQTSDGFSYSKDGKFLVHEGQDVFYADELPDGKRTQVPISKKSSKVLIRLEVTSASH